MQLLQLAVEEQVVVPAVAVAVEAVEEPKNLQTQQTTHQ
jgi:hypothetical protein